MNGYQLSAMVNCLYMSLCESLGTAHANEVLTTLPGLDPKQIREHFRHQLQADKTLYCYKSLKRPYQFTFKPSEHRVENEVTDALDVLEISDQEMSVMGQIIDQPPETSDQSVFKAKQFESDKSNKQALQSPASPAFQASEFKEKKAVDDRVEMIDRPVMVSNFKKLLSIALNRINKEYK